MIRAFRPNQVLSIVLRIRCSRKIDGEEWWNFGRPTVNPGGIAKPCPATILTINRCISGDLRADAAYHQGTVWVY